MRTVFTMDELADRWGVSRSTIRTMEKEGKLHRLPSMPGVRYMAQEVVSLESLDEETMGLTAWERHKMTRELKELRDKVAEYESALLNIAELARTRR